MFSGIPKIFRGVGTVNTGLTLFFRWWGTCKLKCFWMREFTIGTDMFTFSLCRQSSFDFSHLFMVYCCVDLWNSILDYNY